MLGLDSQDVFVVGNGKGVLLFSTYYLGLAFLAALQSLYHCLVELG